MLWGTGNVSVRKWLAAITLMALPQGAFAGDLSIVIVQQAPQISSDLPLASTSETISTELTRTLLIQNFDVKNVRAKQPVLDARRTSARSASQIFGAENWSEQDYGILYSVLPQISTTPIARIARLTAEGEIYSTSTGQVVASFQVAAPESIPLPLDEALCDGTCVDQKIASVSTGLIRELSFVLTQKLHFLREDSAGVDTTDSAAIAKRLSRNSERLPAVSRLTTSDRVYEIDKARAVDFEVYFDFDSSQLTPTAQAQLRPLGRALSGEALRGSHYLIIGHTDAKGSATYNLELSERRAQSVRQYLLQEFAILPKNLTAIGLGEKALKAPSNPEAAINRRVELALIVDELRLEQPAGLARDYTLTFNLLRRDIVVEAMNDLETNVGEEIELLKSNETQRVYSVRTDMPLIRLEEQLKASLSLQGVQIDRIRLSSYGRNLSVDALD
jgi:outer membrane protein OmpA-like peptidoglycan-associated protein